VRRVRRNGLALDRHLPADAGPGAGVALTNDGLTPPAGGRGSEMADVNFYEENASTRERRDLSNRVRLRVGGIAYLEVCAHDGHVEIRLSDMGEDVQMAVMPVCGNVVRVAAIQSE